MTDITTPLVALPADFLSHKNAWRNALKEAADNADLPTEDEDDGSYWRHELAAFDRSYAELEANIAAQQGQVKVNRDEPKSMALAMTHYPVRPDETIQWNQPLWDSDGYPHTLISISAREVVTRVSIAYVIWDRKTGLCTSHHDGDTMTIGNTPMSDAERQKRMDQAIETLRANPPVLTYADQKQAALFEADKQAMLAARAAEMKPMTIKDVLVKFGYEGLRGLPIFDAPEIVYIHDSLLDSSIQEQEDDIPPHLTKRFYGSVVHNDPNKCAWVYSNSPIHVATDLQVMPRQLVPGDVFITSNLAEPGNVSHVARVERLDGDKLHATMLTGDVELSFNRTSGVGEGGEVIVLTGDFIGAYPPELLRQARHGLYPFVPDRAVASENEIPRPRPAA